MTENRIHLLSIQPDDFITYSDLAIRQDKCGPPINWVPHKDTHLYEPNLRIALSIHPSQKHLRDGPTPTPVFPGRRIAGGCGFR